jgi:hypothetical protein
MVIYLQAAWMLILHFWEPFSQQLEADTSQRYLQGPQWMVIKRGWLENLATNGGLSGKNQL